MSELRISTADGDADLEEFASVDADAFVVGRDGRDETLRWLRAFGDNHLLRVARRDGVMVGGYALYVANQFFGGEPVPAALVAAVAVGAAHRRRGVAGELLRDCVQHAAELGGAVAPLTASTTRLYRRWGWEVCGRHVDQRVRTDALAQLRGEGEAVVDPAIDEMLPLRIAHLRHWDGPIDHPPEWIDLMRATATESKPPASCVGWAEDGRLTGYVLYECRRPEQRWVQVRVDELVATTKQATLGLLGHLGGWEALAPEVVFSRSALPDLAPLLYLLPDADKLIALEGRICWMQRLIDPAAAVAARGWRGADGELHLELQGPFERDRGRFVLTARSGRAALEPGGDGRVQLGIGALATWFSGAVSAAELGRIGLVDASADDLETMDAVLGRSRSHMPDHF